MGRKKRKLIVVGKVREFDEAAWKRLLMAYAYYLHEEQQRREAVIEQAEDDDRADGVDS